MKEIDINKELKLVDFIMPFVDQTNDLMPGKWKLVGIQVYLVNEDVDVLAAPGIYSKEFDKESYEHD